MKVIAKNTTVIFDVMLSKGSILPLCYYDRFVVTADKTLRFTQGDNKRTQKKQYPLAC